MSTALRIKGGTLDDLKHLKPGWEIQSAGMRTCSRCSVEKPHNNFFALLPGEKTGGLKGVGRMHRTCGRCRAEVKHAKVKRQKAIARLK